MKTEVGRRSFLKVSSGTAGLFFFSGPISKSLAAVCGLTPAQTAGPFYPGERQFKPENDLTQISGNPLRALGQVVYIKGKVLDTNCQPIQGANVEIWQACATGKYNHPRDPNPAAIDPNFKYWGETFTDENGEYIFKTIIPGAYPASDGWDRPPHIHYRVAKLGFRELITQMYFSGDPLNDKDLILLDIPEHQRQSVIVPFLPSSPDLEPGTLTGTFDLTMQPVRRP